jgi:hypothetical protein
LALLWGLTLSLALTRFALAALGLRWALAWIALALPCLLALVPIARGTGLGLASPILRALLGLLLGALLVLSRRTLPRRLLALTTLLAALRLSLRTALPLLVGTCLTGCLLALAALLGATLALLLRALLGLAAMALGRLLVLCGAGLSATAHSSACSSTHSLGRRYGNSCQQRSCTE